MKRWIAAAVVFAGLVWATVGLAAGGARTGPTIFGANEDQPKFMADFGASIYDQMAAIGMTENVMSVKWDTATPGEIPNRARIAEAIEAAKARGVKVVLAIYPLKARAVADNGPQGFIDFCGLVADAFPDASAYIVGNEPNQPRFWQPQFGARGAQVSAAAVMRVLAGCYDKLHPTGKLVVGVGLSPRGNDNPTARTNRSTSPVRFIAALGAAYRKSGRTEPLMDAFSFHPYPNVNTDAPSVGYRWPNAGVSNYARIKQALWDAFNGTAQLDVERGLPLWIDEAGWQVNTNGLVGYTGAENVPTIDEATQARYHAQLIRLAACDPDVATLHLFHWIDDTARDAGFQSGQYRLDGTPRPAYAQVAKAVAETDRGARCPGTQASWRHLTTVEHARPDFSGAVDQPQSRTTFRIGASADEGTEVTYALVRVDGRAVSAEERAAVRRALEEKTSTNTPHVRIPGIGPGVRVVVWKHARLPAYLRPRLELATRGLDRAFYVYAVSLAAETNPSRTTSFVSRAFQAGTEIVAPGQLAVRTDSAGRVLLESAQLKGKVNARLGTRVEAWFEYWPGTTPTPVSSAVRKTRAVRFFGSDVVSGQLTDLAPRGLWSYRLVARLVGRSRATVTGETKTFALARPSSRSVPLLLVDGIDDAEGGMLVDSVVSFTGPTAVALEVRRLASRGQAGDASFWPVDSVSLDGGLAGEDELLPLDAGALAPGAYLGRVVATFRGREIVRTVRFTVPSPD